VSADVFTEVLGYVATINMITIYVICVYNLRKPRPYEKGRSAIGRRRRRSIYNLFVFCAGILKRLVPCIRQGSSPLPGRRIKENKMQGRTGAQFEALIEEEKRQELTDIRHMMVEEDSISVEEIEEGRNLCLCVHYL
jgi:hypothetical protein